MNFIDAKQRKDRGFSVKDSIKDVSDRANEFEGIIIVTLSKGKEIGTTYSGESDAEMIGLLEVAKSILVDGIRER